MKVEQWGGRRRWLVGVAGALVMLGGLLTLVRVPAEPPVRPTTPGKPAIQLGRTGKDDASLTAQAAMYDQMPLFLPTERNVTARPPVPPEAGQAVLDRDARKLAFGGGGVALSMPAPVEVPKRAVDMLAQDEMTPLFGLGRVDRPAPAASTRTGFIEVLTAGTNRLVLEQALDAGARPPTDRPWRPVEFIALVDEAGLAAPLVTAVRSDVDEVDNYFRNYLAQTLRIGDRLPPGSYRIVIGP